MKIKPMTKSRIETLQYNMQAARLGKAKKALKQISEYKMDQYEDYDDAFISVRMIADEALNNIENILTPKKAKRLKFSIKGG